VGDLNVADSLLDIPTELSAGCLESIVKRSQALADLALKPSIPLLNVLKTNQEIVYQLKEDLDNFKIFKIVPFLHLLLSSCFVLLKPTGNIDISTQNTC